MRSITFHSPLAPVLDRFVRLRQHTGRDYQDQAYLLQRFDRFLVEQKLFGPRITQALTDRYSRALSHLNVRTQYNYFCVVRQFCQYLALDDPQSFVPEPLRHVGSQGAYVPYLYTPEQVQALLEAARALGPAGSLRPQTIETFLGLLYSTGMRTGEALALNLEDLHSDRQALYVPQGKFRKARWLPLPLSTFQALEAYRHQRTRRHPSRPTQSLLISTTGARLSYSSARRAFGQLLDRVGLCSRKDTALEPVHDSPCPDLVEAGDASGVPRPRLHDFRHTFAMHRLLDWYRDGQDLHARLPALATYLGHVDLRSTQVYLQLTPELLEQVDQRFHAHFLNHVQPPGDPS